MPSFYIDETNTDSILHNKYGTYSKNELVSQLKEGSLTVEELSQVYGLESYQINHVLNALGIDYRNNLNSTRVLSSVITPSMHQFLIGTLLGDACMKDRRSYHIAHSLHQMDYLYHTAEKLGSFVSTVSYKTCDDGEAIGFWTHCHDVFESYFNRFYSHGRHRKFFTQDSVPDLEPEGLAYWFMDDGKYGEYGMGFSVGKITAGEADIFRVIFKDKFGIETTLHYQDKKKGHYNLYVKAESRALFIDIISPYIIPSMRYKLEGTAYPDPATKEEIVKRHLSYCEIVQRPVRFSGDDWIRDEIDNKCSVVDPKKEYINKIRKDIADGKLVSHTEIRKPPTDDELKDMLNKGMTDQGIAVKYNMGRNRIAQMRASLGISRKCKREKDEMVKFPCMNVKTVPAYRIVSNDYNPNFVCTPEMNLLIHSIEEDGLTQPIVVFHDKELDKYIVVDGFHRYNVLTQHFKCSYIPVVVIDKSLNDRMASTIRHNRARGKHQIDLMGMLVDKLQKQGWLDEQIAKHLGLGGEELLRLRQQVGCAKFLAGQQYSKSWEMRHE